MRPADRVNITVTKTQPCDDLPLAQTSIGMQKWREIYESDKALMRGTIFCELDKPFRGSSR